MKYQESQETWLFGSSKHNEKLWKKPKNFEYQVPDAFS